MQQPPQTPLPQDDPLYHLLAETVLRETLQLPVEAPIFDVFSVDPHGVIYRYVERMTGVDLACKFYGNRRANDDGSVSRAETTALLRREFENLQRVWKLGMNRPPYRVVRPLAMDVTLNNVLVEEYAAGPNLDHYLKGALLDGAHDELADRLADLAGFLATLHDRSAMDTAVDPANGRAYLTKVLGQLAAEEVITADEQAYLQQLCDAWRSVAVLGQAQGVLIHGDVTPVNIVFGDDHEVIAIDLERLRPDDAAVDLGIVLAELRHAFLRTAHDASGAEPLTRRFFTTYVTARGLRDADARALEARCRFYGGSMLLRIARNDWLDMEYRRVLCTEGAQWLAVPGEGLFSSTSTTR